ncbi:uncharacterized protein K489DRAFT_32124 [Dissoconium aciculare CBS 342.82]|uniref:Mid2 domain-containing protein n=1 Tax=Dissoconium aciculare CBS 342.82 TaxID=1314786 RepID=A0A6J3MJ56_9PEZI|nr:uncharacterized protein K489DRAFT_32124 [Dissoconium aciculare CBS 342.82]KAF1827946.1 hypothetical protein K489DRAFT_32124 [Dissoconium aciculare CBS 342.82]
MSISPKTQGGTVTSFLPLTTTYTAPASCSSIFQLEGPDLVAFDPAYALRVDSKVVCNPSAVTSWWLQALLGVNTADHTDIQLGPLVCPSGWQTLASSVSDKSSTFAFCCPQSYSLVGQSPGSANGNCVSMVSKGQVITYASTGINTNSWAITTTTLERASSVGAIAVQGWNVQAVMAPTPTSTPASTQTFVTSTNSALPGSSANGSQNSNLASTSSPSPTTTTIPDSSNSLSVGAQAGIGVGASLGLIGIAALIVALVLLSRRRRSEAEDKPELLTTELPYETKSQPPPSYGAAQQPFYEADHQTTARGFHELDSSHYRNELYAGQAPVELSSNNSPHIGR